METRGDQSLISHLLAELRQVTELRIQVASLVEWRSATDHRVTQLETTSAELSEASKEMSKSKGIAKELRKQALALFQWIFVFILAVMSAMKILPPWIEKLVSALVRAN